MPEQKRKAVFLDRDGTIARDVHYCCRPDDLVLLPTAPNAVKLLNDTGFTVIVVTNQSALARGYLTEATLGLIHHQMKDEFDLFGAKVDGIYYCPHHPDERCGCRKPQTGLFRRAAEEMGIDIADSVVVGDTQMDIGAGKALNCPTVLVTTGPTGGRDVTDRPDFTADSLMEAAQWIISNHHL